MDLRHAKQGPASGRRQCAARRETLCAPHPRARTGREYDSAGRRPTAFSDPYDGSEELMKPIAALVLTIALLVPATALASSSSTCQAYNKQTCNVVPTTQTTGP